jgi:hypothetical protein
LYTNLPPDTGGKVAFNAHAADRSACSARLDRIGRAGGNAGAGKRTQVDSSLRHFQDASTLALAMLLRDHSSDPLNEPLVRVIALVDEPDAGAQSQTARVLACNDGADDWSPFTFSDVRQERFEGVAAECHWPVVTERVDLCEHGAL